MNKLQTKFIDPQGGEMNCAAAPAAEVKVMHVLEDISSLQAGSLIFPHFNSQSLFKSCKEHLNNYSQQHRRESFFAFITCCK